ncbi:BON domain-containing protein [Pokkaliibacter sp. CJK22405]|uniref:BON domain-containing protein n=1 Tax=Pokkaliibacter sp. CJK22405 TaxID=3384615 RepID=UPI003984F98E
MKKPIGVALIALCTGLAGCSNIISATRDEPIQEDYTSRTVGKFVDDQVIDTKASVNINKGSQALQQSRVSVTSQNGIVLLVGQVPNQSVKQEAEQIVQQVRGVRQIQNRLSVGPNATLLMQSQDAFITTQIKTKLLAEKNLPSSQIKVITEAGIVYLMGRVTQAQADLAVSIIQQVGGIQQIVKIFEYI